MKKSGCPIILDVPTVIQTTGSVSECVKIMYLYGGTYACDAPTWIESDSFEIVLSVVLKH